MTDASTIASHASRPVSPASGSTDALRRLDAVAQVALRLVRSAPAGRVLLAQTSLGVDPRWLAGPRGEELLAEMRRAEADTAEPLPIRRVERTLRAAWGASPAGELDDLEPEPVAVTPTSQIHRGTLDGAAVAVKVQRPGLARSVHQDLALLDSLLAPLGAAFPMLDARGVLREVAERVCDEFDLEHEASSTRQLHRRFRDHPRIVVPAPVSRLAGEDVLVREWLDGEPLQDAEPGRRDAAAAALVEFVLGGAASGFMNAGLTAPDVLALEDGRVAIVDHGICCAVDADRLRGALDALRALLAADADRLAAAVSALGVLDADHAARALALLDEVLPVSPEPTRLDADALRAAGRRIGARRDDAARLVRAGAPAPADIWPMRGVAQLFGTIARIGATGDWPRLAERALAGGG